MVHFMMLNKVKTLEQEKQIGLINYKASKPKKYNYGDESETISDEPKLEKKHLKTFLKLLKKLKRR